MLEKKMRPISLDKIEIQDPFWREYMELVRNHVIPYQWEALNDRIEGAAPSHCIRNFRVASGREQGTFNGMVFQDSDLYKWLEAVAYSLMWHPDEKLEKTADDAIDLIAAAQQEDGYLDTYYIINGLDKRFTNLMNNHELYCMGHMVEAAVAYYKATGKRKFLDVAIRFVGCADANLGVGEGKKPGYPGHEVAEMALAALYEVTKDPKHLKLAKYFIDQRGQKPLYFEEEYKKYGNKFHWSESYFQMQYYQAGKPVRQQDKAEGHAVRAVYLYSGMAEVASKTEDEELFRACEKLWKNIVEKQMYITGAIGASHYGESFTFDYDLPNDTVYGETCAAIGLVFFARRMLEISRDGRYADVMERALYNGVISGMSLDGTRFFYVNPLEVVPESSEKDQGKCHVKSERQKWFGCACCPPNVARLLSSIGGYAFEQDGDTFYLNLFIGGELEAELGGKKNRFRIETSYPWNGDVKISVSNDEAVEFTCALRIPGWCRNYSLKINGEAAACEVVKGYVSIRRRWNRGDEIQLSMEMPAELIAANPKVRADVGKVAVMRGPVVYCLEEADNGAQLQELYLADRAQFTETYEPGLLKDVVILTADGKRLCGDEWKDGALYKTYTGQRFRDQKLKFIPYYAWSNRKIGEMTVWVRI